MSIGVLLITHNNLGATLLHAVKDMFENLPFSFTATHVGNKDDPHEAIDTLCKKLQRLDKGDGVLILTDAYGSTPSNIAYKLKEKSPMEIRIVSGVNVPMLMTLINLNDLSLDQITKRIVSGGKKGIIDDEHIPFQD